MNAARLLIFCAIALGAAGCTSLKPGEYARRKQNSLHIIAANGQGHPVDPLTRDRLSDSAYVNRVDESIDALLASQQDTVVIFIHGGMVSLNNSINRAFDTTPQILADGIYPLFFSWHSELFDSYFDHLLWIRNGERKKYWGPVTLPLVALSDIGRGVSRFPITWYSQLRTDWNTTQFRKERAVLDALDFQMALLKLYEQDPSQHIAINSGDHHIPFWRSLGSLLEWLDSIFVEPETVLDQRMGKWVTTMRTAGQVPKRLRPRVTFKTYDVVTKNRDLNPDKHGDFDEGPFWKEAFWKVDSQR